MERKSVMRRSISQFILDYKASQAKYEKILTKNVPRKSNFSIVYYLAQETNFFKTPYTEGQRIFSDMTIAEHSLLVLDKMLQLRADDYKYDGIPLDSITIVALFCDAFKSVFYEYPVGSKQSSEDINARIQDFLDSLKSSLKCNEEEFLTLKLHMAGRYVFPPNRLLINYKGYPLLDLLHKSILEVNNSYDGRIEPALDYVEVV